MASPAGALPMIPRSSRSAISSSLSPSSDSTSWLCSPSSGAGVRWNAVGPATRSASEACCAWRSGVHRMVDVFEEAAMHELRQVADRRCGCITLATGTPASQSVSTISSPVRSAHQRAQVLVDVDRGAAVVRRRSHSAASIAQSGLPSAATRPPTARRWRRRSPPSRRAGRTRRSSLVRYRFCGAAVGPRFPSRCSSAP